MSNDGSDTGMVVLCREYGGFDPAAYSLLCPSCTAAFSMRLSKNFLIINGHTKMVSSKHQQVLCSNFNRKLVTQVRLVLWRDRIPVRPQVVCVPTANQAIIRVQQPLFWSVLGRRHLLPQPQHSVPMICRLGQVAMCRCAEQEGTWILAEQPRSHAIRWVGAQIRAHAL